MDEKMATIGYVAGLEADHHQGSNFDALQKYVLLFCPTGESDQGSRAEGPKGAEDKHLSLSQSYRPTIL